MCIEKTAKGNIRDDESLQTFKDLLANGYEYVQWKAHGRADNICKKLEGRRWLLKDFIIGKQTIGGRLLHKAPIFETSHVQCKCRVLVYGKGKKSILVDYRGL